MSDKGGKGLPLVAFRLDPKHNHHFDEFAVAHQLRERGWVVPGNARMLLVPAETDLSSLHHGSQRRQAKAYACCGS